MIVAIDGTGVDDDDAYAREMAGSFCEQLTDPPNYHRGPRLAGRETAACAEWAVGRVVTEMAKPGAGKVMLAGYSRGGCAAIIACKRLESQGVKVDSLFLFDAVDMQMSDAHINRTIRNASFVAHARSGRHLAFWARNPVKSRFYFYNTGLYLDGGGTYVEKSFLGSHAALGGTPWVDIKEDAACALAVATWMSGQLSSRGVGIQLKVSGKSV